MQEIDAAHRSSWLPVCAAVHETGHRESFAASTPLSMQAIPVHAHSPFAMHEQLLQSSSFLVDPGMHPASDEASLHAILVHRHCPSDPHVQVLQSSFLVSPDLQGSPPSTGSPSVFPPHAAARATMQVTAAT